MPSFERIVLIPAAQASLNPGNFFSIYDWLFECYSFWPVRHFVPLVIVFDTGWRRFVFMGSQSFRDLLTLNEQAIISINYFLSRSGKETQLPIHPFYSLYLWNLTSQMWCSVNEKEDIEVHQCRWEIFVSYRHQLTLIRKNKCSEVKKSILDGESLVLKHFQYWLETIYTSTILETFSLLSRMVTTSTS